MPGASPPSEWGHCYSGAMSGLPTSHSFTPTTHLAQLSRRITTTHVQKAPSPLAVHRRSPPQLPQSMHNNYIFVLCVRAGTR